MPRPAKRGAAASETLQIRVTPAERDLIDAHRGFHTLTDFILDCVMTRIKAMNTPVKKTEDDYKVAWPTSAEPLHPLTNHRHKRGELIFDTTIKGVRQRTWRCAEPGCGQELHG